MRNEISICLGLLLLAMNGTVAGERQSADEGKDPYWDWSEVGKIRHVPNLSEVAVVLNMQGRKVVMECHVNMKEGLEYQARFFNVKDPHAHSKVVFGGGVDSRPVLSMDGRPRHWFRPAAVSFDGCLTIEYRPYREILPSRTVYPSVDKALVLENWECHNGSGKSVELKVITARTHHMTGEQVETEWLLPAVEKIEIKPGESLKFSSSVQARRTNEAPLVVDAVAEYAARQALAKAAWQGSGRARFL